MSTRLHEGKLGSDVYNLTFGGGSSLTGLFIIRRVNIIPEVIFVETNIIERKLNRGMLNDLFTPVIWKIRGNILSLQYTYQPINIVLTGVNNFRSSRSNKITDEPHEKILKASLIRQRQLHSNTDIFVGSKELTELKGLIDYFKKLGAKIVFFQMPVHKTILFSKRYAARKSILIKLFPQAGFNWIKKNDVSKYRTSDGIHLLYKSASEYSSVLNEIIKKT